MVVSTATAPNSRLALQSQTSPDQIDGESEQFIVIDFRNEWDFISVFARNTAQYTQRGGNSIAACCNRQFDNVFRVKVIGLGAKEAPAECSIPWSTGRMER